MCPERDELDRHDRVHQLIAGLRSCTLDEGQQVAVNKLEKTMLRGVPATTPLKREHEHAIFLCCLQELTAQVREYASEATEVESDKVEALFELLSLHVEESWESFDGNIVAPEAPDQYEEQRADFDDDVMSDLLKPQGG